MPDGATSVSVVIGAHNYAGFLPAAIDSALAQDEAPADVVVVDDGSSDDTPAVLSRYRSEAVVMRTPNRGQLAALATGYAATRGDMVVFLDADDVLLPTAVRMIANASDGTGVSKVHWPMPEIDALGQPAGRCRPTQPLPAGDLAEQLCRLGPEGAAYPPTSGNAWQRRFLDQALPGPVDDFRLAADQYLAVLAPFFGPVAALTQPQSLYRRHEASAHSSAPLAARARISHEHYRKSTLLLRELCHRRGWPCPWWTWDERSWTRRFERSLDELDFSIAPGSIAVLIDQDEWALPPGRSWTPVPVPSRNGHYWGLPASSEQIVGELRDRRAEGADYVVVSDSAFWWLDQYTGLEDYLSSSCTLEESNDRFRLYRWPDGGGRP
jgi:glycosyl transferase family 2